MKRHPRIREAIKWGSAVVTVLLVALWIWSDFYFTAWWRESGWGWFCYEGYFTVRTIGGEFTNTPPTVFFYARKADAVMQWGLPSVRADRVWSLSVPLWMMVSASLLFTLTTWRLDTLARRRARLNLCPKCNYDRTGLAAGAVCPECGTAT